MFLDSSSKQIKTSLTNSADGQTPKSAAVELLEATTQAKENGL